MDDDFDDDDDDDDDGDGDGDDDGDDDDDDDDDDGATSEFPLNFNLLRRPEKANPLKLSTLDFLPNRL